jgi:hypothetical protein
MLILVAREASGELYPVLTSAAGQRPGRGRKRLFSGGLYCSEQKNDCCRTKIVRCKNIEKCNVEGKP